MSVIFHVKEGRNQEGNISCKDAKKISRKGAKKWRRKGRK